MREIKFRFWDKGIQKMKSLQDILEANTEYCPQCRLSLPPILDFDVEGLLSTGMQFTGLKDKNGKEIYQGDIVQYNQNFSLESFVEGLPKTINVIKYVDEYAQFNISGWFGGDAFHKYHKQIEIIGNIYENPNLLNNV